MSLKAFHVLFIVVSIGLAAWVAAWGLGGGGETWERVLGGASALAAVGLVAYLVAFLRKMKGVSYL